MQLESTAGNAHVPYSRSPHGAFRSLQRTDAWRALTALVVEVVYGALRRVVEGGGLVDAPPPGAAGGRRRTERTSMRMMLDRESD